MQFVQCLWLEVFVEKRCLSHLKTHLTWLPWKPSVSCDQALDKLSEKPNSRQLVPEEHGFQKGAQCAPPGRRSSKKSLAWIGLTCGIAGK